MNILADTCFWISLCDPSESDHAETVSMMEKILSNKSNVIIVPHPVLYETLRTEMVKKPNQVLNLIKYFSRVEKIPDTEYINEAFNLVDQQAHNKIGTSSMVDFALMLVAEDPKNNVKAILTRNARDFASFCQKKCIYMVNSITMLNAI